MRQLVRPIIALDFPDAEATRNFLGQFDQDSHLFVKVGMELFYAAGPDIVREITAAGHDVFLDLKLHDIPHTVSATVWGIIVSFQDYIQTVTAGARCTVW